MDGTENMGDIYSNVEFRKGGVKLQLPRIVTQEVGKNT